MDDTPQVEEKLFEEVSLEDLSSDGESGTPPETVGDGEALEIPGEPLSFEMLTEDAALPTQENSQDTVITEGSFEPVSLDDAGDMKLELDLSPLELPEDPEPDALVPEDFSIELPAEPDAGVEIPSTLRDELKNVLTYMDKLLESLPEEKIEEFAKSEHYTTYKKLFDELGIE